MNFLNPLSIASILIFIGAWIYHYYNWRQTKRLYKAEDKKIREYFDELIRTVEGTTNKEEQWGLDDYLQHVMDDIGSILAREETDSDRRAFLKRYLVKRENRNEINPLLFCQYENVTRQLIDIYPPLGILGTVASIFIGLISGGTTNMEGILSNFATAMWTTIIGLLCWIILTVRYAQVEPQWERITESGNKARDILWDIERAARRENVE